MLIALHDRLGEAMSPCGVHVANVPDDVTYSVSSYNAEWIAEVHRTWSVHETDGTVSETVYCFSLDSTFEELMQRYGRS